MRKFPIGSFGQVPTPFYYYDKALLEATLDALKRALPNERYKVHYAVKANNNPQVMSMIASAGLGADCVSGGEIEAAKGAGFSTDSIVYAGVGKSDAEILLGLRLGIECFNVESIEELEIINELAEREGLKANVALRVNPNIDAHTHKYITTGLAENKFGIALEGLDDVVAAARGMKGVELVGLHFHIGSQLVDFKPYEMLCNVVNELVERYESQGIEFKIINVGGGLGIDYDNPDQNPIADFEGFFKVFKENLRLRDGQELHFELGRSIVAQCGSLITKVFYVKEGRAKSFVIVDAGFTDLIRPALYGAHHKIEQLTSTSENIRRYDVVGPICESSDTFDTDIELPETQRGDLLAIRSAGAYGEVMASTYNCRRLPGGLMI